MKEWNKFVLLPKIKNDNGIGTSGIRPVDAVEKVEKEDDKEPLYVGFFNTGAYQDQISGYGGIKHCLIPSPKHVIIEYDKNGKLEEWVYAKEQTAQSMLKILGYLR